MPKYSNPFTPPDPITPDLRDAWMLREGITFLNHGSFGAVPKSVFEAQTEWRRRIEAEPIEILYRRGPELIAAAKQAVGGLLGIRADDFGLVTNATEGVNAVLRSILLQPGDELLATSHVYNAVWQSMQWAAARRGATVRKIDVPLPIQSAEQIASTILQGVSERTKLLLIDHITSPTAVIFPVKQIIDGCARRGVDVFVDGAHAPGMVDLNIETLSPAYYTGNLHKWVCAPKGSGILWVRRDRQAAIHPLVVSHHYGEGFAKEFDWQGTRDVSAWLTVPAAMKFMSHLGWERIRSHNHAMARWAHVMICNRLDAEPISPRDGSLLGSMAAFPAPAVLDDLTEPQGKAFQHQFYKKHHIEIPLMRWCDRWLMRVSCQVYNTPADYERVVSVLENLLEKCQNLINNA